MTSVDDELFVLLYRDSGHMAVYSIGDYKLLLHFNVPGFTPNEHSDMTSCVRQKCLCISDNFNECIHRYDVASRATSKWSVPGRPLGLSVTPSCNLLVACRCSDDDEPDKLVELNSDSGECVREIALQLDIQRPHHSVQLTTGQLVICHGWLSGLHRVCVVGDDGNVTHSYGGERGSAAGQLSYPYHLAVDEDSRFIFVADSHNQRVVLLRPSLKFARYLTDGSAHQQRLYFHQATRRLYVGQSDGDVNVIQL